MTSPSPRKTDFSNMTCRTWEFEVYRNRKKRGKKGAFEHIEIVWNHEIGSLYSHATMNSWTISWSNGSESCGAQRTGLAELLRHVQTEDEALQVWPNNTLAEDLVFITDTIIGDIVDGRTRFLQHHSWRQD